MRVGEGGKPTGEKGGGRGGEKRGKKRRAQLGPGPLPGLTSDDLLSSLWSHFPRAPPRSTAGDPGRRPLRGV